MTNRAYQKVSDPQACPICGSNESFKYLSSPDRYHGREAEYTLLRCAACQCVWTTNPPKPEEMGEHYSNDYHVLMAASAESKSGRRWQEHRKIILNLKQCGDILDVGCSSGSFLASMKSDAWRLHGIEMDRANAERARQASGADVFIGDIMQAPFAENSFDVITAFDVIEHMYNPQEFLRKVVYWLRPGGIFFARVPNIDSMESHLFGRYWYGLELPRHLFHFSLRSMRQLADSVGVHDVRVSARSSGSHAGHSLRYVRASALRQIGIISTPMAKARRPSFLWRVVRKLFQLTFVKSLVWVASKTNAGVIIDVILRKDATQQ